LQIEMMHHRYHIVNATPHLIHLIHLTHSYTCRRLCIKEHFKRQLVVRRVDETLVCVRSKNERCVGTQDVEPPPQKKKVHASFVSTWVRLTHSLSLRWDITSPASESKSSLQYSATMSSILEARAWTIHASIPPASTRQESTLTFGKKKEVGVEMLDVEDCKLRWCIIVITSATLHLQIRWKAELKMHHCCVKGWGLRWCIVVITSATLHLLNRRKAKLWLQMCGQWCIISTCILNIQHLNTHSPTRIFFSEIQSSTQCLFWIWSVAMW
jgi:hypothetical protein